MTTKTIQKNILEELELNNLPEETQIKLLTKMTETVLKRITIKVLEQLSEPERDEFYQLQESGDTDKITSFLEVKIPSYNKMVLKEVKDFTADIQDTISGLGTVASS